MTTQLTPEQQAVVQHQRGHARVIAVAGAGKTRPIATNCCSKDVQSSKKSMIGRKKTITDTFKSSTNITALGRVRWALFHGRMPALDVRIFVADSYFNHTRKINGAHGGDIRDGELVARNPFVIG